MQKIPSAMLAWRRALHFSPDRGIDASWFASYEGTDFEGENPLDVRAIDRADGSYDFISLSQVLDFVAEDQQAFAEVARVATPWAIVHLAFTSAMSAPTSEHFAEPRGTHGRLHEYGRDVFDHLGAREHCFDLVELSTTDPVTGVQQPAYLLTRTHSDAQTLRVALADHAR